MHASINKETTKNVPDLKGLSANGETLGKHLHPLKLNFMTRKISLLSGLSSQASEFKGGLAFLEKTGVD